MAKVANRRKPKKINVYHGVPSAERPFAILPLGAYFNKEIREAHSGDIVTFWTDYLHEDREIIRMAEVDTKSAVFNLLVQNIYGSTMTAAKLFIRWRAWCLREGYGANGYDKNKALLIEVGEVDGAKIYGDGTDKVLQRNNLETKYTSRRQWLRVIRERQRERRIKNRVREIKTNRPEVKQRIGYINAMQSRKKRLLNNNWREIGEMYKSVKKSDGKVNKE